MPHQFITQLAKQSALHELTDEQWLELSKKFASVHAFEQDSFLNTLAAHSGVSHAQLSAALTLLSNEISNDTQRNAVLEALHQTQKNTTAKISDFQKHPFFNTINTSSLSISRSEWRSMIDKFEQQGKSILTMVFFISSLSSIRNVSYEGLLQTLSSRAQPGRSAKKISEPSEVTLSHSRRRTNKKDKGVNSLIIDTSIPHTPLRKKLGEQGVRVTDLQEDATPEKGYTGLKHTPGGTKARPMCEIQGVTFFKPLTPYSKNPMDGRVDVREASKENIGQALPKSKIRRVAPVHFTATLDLLKERAGTVRRQDQKSLTKASASDVFRAHGIEIKAKDGRRHHWAHLIAYFLGGPHDTPNMVPSTDAANYNTLEAIEQFIRAKLASKETAEITINVIPSYSGEALIPDLLTYGLTWSETDNTSGQEKTCSETFYINPQSYQRLTKSILDSIETVRNDRFDNGPKIK